MTTDALARGAPSDVGMPAAGPVFIAGPDRSGTTLMFALLASHPDLCMVRRTNVWRYFDGRYGDLGVADNFERCLADMLRYRRMRHLHPDADRIRREFAAGPPTYGRLFALFYEHHAEREGRSRWGDKSLHTEHYADRLFAEYPQARVVHMVRDPRDRYASVRRRNGQDLARVGAATGRWLESARAALRNAARYPGYLVVRYEDLVADPPATLRRVCDHIAAEYLPEMLSLDGLPELRDSGGNSSFGDMVPGAISTKAVGRFREALRPYEHAFIERVAGPTMRALGYERVPPDLSWTAAVRFGAYDMPVQGARMLGWLALARLRRNRGEPLPAGRLVPSEGSKHGDS